MKNIILAANPSFATDEERDFWLQFERVTEKEGWVLFKHAMRNIPKSPSTMVLPARLSDVARFLGPLPVKRAHKLPSWISFEMFQLILEWEHRRWSLDEQDIHIESGLRKLVWHVDSIYNRLKPAITVVTNKIDHGCGLFELAGRHYRSEIVFFERSLADSFFAEPLGMFGESVIWQRFTDRNRAADKRWGDVGEDVVRSIRENPNGFRAQVFNRALAEAEVISAARPRIFVPMDNVLWTGWAQADHPQKIVDYGECFPSPSEMINRIGDIAAEKGGDVFVKLHPADREKYTITRNNIRIIDTPIDTALENCDICVAFLTKVAAVSISMGVPTVIAARNPIAISGSSIYCESPNEISTAISAALNSTRAETDARSERFAIFAGWLVSEFFISSGNNIDLTRPNCIEFVKNLIQSNSDRTMLGGGASRDVRALVERVASRQFAGCGSDKAELSQKTVFVCDITEVAAIYNERSFEYIYAERILKGLSSHPFVEIRLYVNTNLNGVDGKGIELCKSLAKMIGVTLLLDESVSGVFNNSAFVHYSPTGIPWTDLGTTAAVVLGTLHASKIDSLVESEQEDNLAHPWSSVVEQFDVKYQIIASSAYAASALTRIHSQLTGHVFGLPMGSLSPIQIEPSAREVFLSENSLLKYKYLVICLPCNIEDQRVGSENRLLEIAKELLKIQIKVVFIDESNIEESVRAYFDVESQESLVTFVRAGSTDEQAILFDSAAAMIALSDAGYEALLVSEAMAYGCPIISSSSGPIPEIVGDGGLYVNPDNPGSVCSAAMSVLASATLRRELSKSAKDLVRHRNWSRLVDGVLRYAGIMSEKLEAGGVCVSELHGDRIGPNEIEDSYVFKVFGGMMQDTGRWSVMEGQYRPVHEFVEDDKNSVHLVAWDVPRRSFGIKVSVIIRCLKRKNFQLFVAVRDGVDVAKCTISLDLEACTIRAVRSVLGGIFADDISITKLDSGLIKVEAALYWSTKQGEIVRMGFGPIDDSGANPVYRGQSLKSFELLDAMIINLGS